MTQSTPEILLMSSPDIPNITAYNASTGSILAQFTGSRSPRKGLTLIGKALIAASHISSSDTTTSSGSIHLYNWWSSIPSHNLTLPEPVAPIIATSDGLYLFCGGVSGYIHALSLPSGDFIRSFPAHCNKPVSCLTINDDGSLLISGGDDGTICVYPILRLLDSSSFSDSSTQFGLYTHGAPVTAIVIGIGGCNSTIISSSLDCTCKFWSLAHGSHMRTVSFPCVIWALVVDSTDSNFYAGGSDGRVYVGVLKVNRRKLVGSSDDDEVVAWTSEHNGAVTALAMVNEGRNLVSASEDGSVWVWEVESGSVVRVIGNGRGSICDIVVAEGIRDGNGFRFRMGGGGEYGAESLGFFGREISREVREVSEMEEMLNVVVKDRRRAIDRLEAAIGTYERLLGLILKEAKRGSSTNNNNNTKSKAEEG